MDRKLWTEEAEETVRHVFQLFIEDVYDDPRDLDAAEVKRLEDAGKFLGVDIWDRDIFGRVTYREYARLREISNG